MRDQAGLMWMGEGGVISFSALYPVEQIPFLLLV